MMRASFASLVVSALSAQVRAQTRFAIANVAGQFAIGTGVLESLSPSIDPSFDFSPSDVFHLRNGPGQYHTGDLTFRYRRANESTWTDADTAALRLNVTNLPPPSNSLLTSSLNPALGNSSAGLSVHRTWAQDDGDLTLSFTLNNTGPETVEIGSLGMPIEFNNIFTDRTSTETTDKCVLVDPYLGVDAGYVQVTRLTGTGPSLVITPLNADSPLEAWRFLTEPEDGPLGYQAQTYEGNYAWEVYSQAYAENEWKDVEPWNAPTSARLAPGKELTVGLRFSVASTIQQIEDAVSRVGVPTAVGIPGYVVPHDLTAQLFLNATQDVAAVAVEPEGALRLLAHSQTYGDHWVGFDVQANEGAFGRVRVNITYADHRTQAIHYWIAQSGPTALAQLGEFSTTEQWYTDTSDPFGRAPSVITYDHDAGDRVLQDNRTWIAGLSDEGGAGSFLAAGMKQSVSPVADEVSKLEAFVHDVVWGRLQISSGRDTYAVRKSLFFYQPDLVPGYVYDPRFNWTSVPGESWNQSAAYLIDRTYDYVHVSALYWGLYRAGRTHPEMLQRAGRSWYLLQAYHTVMFAFGEASDGTPITGYTDVGLMGETVWGELLADLKVENHTTEAANLAGIMRSRQQYWASEADPFGSEMQWDSTGQEAVYYWSDFFNDTTTAQKTVASIRGYMPTMAHWGWNGNARRYWDFLYGGAIDLARIERQIHHYGSGLNALAMLSHYRAAADPSSRDAIYDLRVGYGGNQGPLSNIHADGFAAMAFHSYPDTLRWDAYSGDYGPNFLGHVLGAATYLVEHPDFGWVSFGGQVRAAPTTDHLIVTEPKDTVRHRIFVAPVGLYITVDAGVITNFTYDTRSHEVTVSVAGDGAGPTPGGGDTQPVVMTWEQTTPDVPIAMPLTTPGLTPTAGGDVIGVPRTGAATVTFARA